ncbi:MAG TPA: phage major capsid protein [Gaiellaceae bacterium]|jgi:HK97 family phage major capsid protein|nr:phage major capsid protein [Gaiellaceae bacterium]
MRPERLATIVEIVHRRVEGVRLTPDEIRAELEAARRQRETVVPTQGAVGVLPVQGVITPKAGLMSEISGGCALDSFLGDLQAMMQNPQITAVVLDIDSPGGSTDMVPETGAAILAMRGKGKPIVAVANTEAASAAYWIAACCDEVVVTPSGAVGSIGVYSAHQDVSGMQEQMGVKTTLISAGKYKTEGSPFGPLSEEALEAAQANVDEFYGMFTAAVAKGRGVSQQDVIDGFGQGRMVNAAEAVKAGMADSVGTLADTIGKLSGGKAAPGVSRRRSAELALPMAALVPGLGTFAEVDVTSFGEGQGPVIVMPPATTVGVLAGAIAPHSTEVIDEPWDAGEVEKALPDGKQAEWKSVFAWFADSTDDNDTDDDGLPDAKSDWKFPHHTKVEGPAVISAVRDGLARLDDSDIPEGDKDGVKAHLQRHLDDFDAKKGSALDLELEATATPPANATNDKEKNVKTIEELVARQDEIRARQEELDATFAGELMPADAKSEFDDLQEEWQNLKATVTEMRERKAMLQEKGAAAPAASRVEIGSFSTRSPEANENVWDIAGYRSRARSIDELGSLFKDGAKRALEIAQIPNENINEGKAKAHVLKLLANDTQDGSFARHMLATGSDQYRRAWSKAVRGLPINGTEKQALDMYALTIGTPSDGGYAIPYTLDPTVILASNGAVNPIRQISRQAQITGHQWLGVTTSDGVVASYGPELTPASDNSPTLAQPVLEVEKAQAFVPLSIEVSQDWIGVEAELSKLFADAKDVLEAQKFFFGAGHGSHEPEGLLTALEAVGGSIIVETASVNAFARDDLYLLENAVADRFEPNSCFVANRAFYNAVRSVTDDTFNIFIPVQQGSGRGDGGNTGFQLLGYPAWRASAMSKLTSTGGEYIAVLGDFEQFLVVDRIGMSVEFIPHLFDTGTGYPLGSRGLYAYWRNSSQVLTANAFRVLQVQHT